MQLNLENDNSAPCQIPESFMLELQNPKKTRPKKPRNISVNIDKRRPRKSDTLRPNENYKYVCFLKYISEPLEFTHNQYSPFANPDI